MSKIDIDKARQAVDAGIAADHALANDGRAEFRVWWIPQIPGKPFEVEAPDYATAKLITSTLANYDLFQFENNIKGDYCNSGGVNWKHPDLTEGDWVDLDADEAEEYGWEVTEATTGGPPYAVGDVVTHPDGRTVKIASGQYWSNGRVSNWWTWNEVNADGSLGEPESGYGWTPRSQET